MDLRLFPSSQHLKPPSRGRETDRNGSPGRPPDDGAPEPPNEKNSRSPFRRLQASKKEPPPPPPPKPQFVQPEKPHLYRHENVPINVLKHAPPPPSIGAANWTHIPRPLSDIRETTEPSLTELGRSQSDRQSKRQSVTELRRHGSHSGASRVSPKGTLRRTKSQDSKRQASQELPNLGKSRSSNPQVSIQNDGGSIFGIPSDNVPRRSTSRGSSTIRGDLHSKRPSTRRGRSSFEDASNEPKRVDFKRVSQEIPARSAPFSSRPQADKRSSPTPSFSVEDLLDFPNYKHPKMKLELQIGAPLFVGGGNVEGNVRVIPNDTERRRTRNAFLESIVIDLIGVEELSGTKRSVFLNLSTELDCPDQGSRTAQGRSELLYPYSSTSCSTPFSINLPLDVGPPPFNSKHARIRYVLASTVWIQDVERPTSVRCSQEIQVLSVYDPEKALMSLPSPLTAMDTFSMRRSNGLENITIKAGLHRQVWVSGTSVFVDVCIENESRKPVRKIELQLERAILCYKHVCLVICHQRSKGHRLMDSTQAAATTTEKSAGQARIFDSNERVVLSKATFKHGTNGWNEFAAFATNTRTFDLALPRGHATVRCGKFFEVRFFLNVVASLGYTKSVSAQLPVILIHMNSLDVVPNSVARVAAAIEEKRGGREPHAFDAYQERHLGSTTIGEPDTSLKNDARRARSAQGRAFAAPRTQSLKRMRSQQGEWEELGRVLEKSPRKQAPYVKRNNSTGSAPQKSRGSPERSAGPSMGQATIFQVGPENAEVVLSRRRPLQDRSNLQDSNMHRHNAKSTRESTRNAPEHNGTPGKGMPSKPQSNKSGSTNSTPRFIRRLASFGSIHYRTPPSNRKARAFAKEDTEKLRNCLQHKPSYDSGVSKPASPKPISMDFQARRPAPPTPTQTSHRRGARARVALPDKLHSGGKSPIAIEQNQLVRGAADSNDNEPRERRDVSSTPASSTGRHGIKNFKDRLEASGFEVRWLRFRGKSKDEREEEKRRQNKEVEMERLGWI
ncbi:MAG: hypothetical protein M1822_006460 [Bathelium mastoideum]|nr:MAG: hypothetical protein M1822_006460 [Bathelium mastoideum]